MSMHDDVKYVLYSEKDLQEIVNRLGAQITKDYQGKNLLIIPILKGSVLFAADLIRKIDVPCELDFMVVSSYGNGTETTGKVIIKKDISVSLEGKDVLLVEDIFDSGVTLIRLKEELLKRIPASLRLCTLLDKPDRRRCDTIPEYIGSQVPDEFIIGYGLDYAEKYRNLPYIGVLKPEVYEN